MSIYKHISTPLPFLCLAYQIKYLTVSITILHGFEHYYPNYMVTCNGNIYAETWQFLAIFVYYILYAGSVYVTSMKVISAFLAASFTFPPNHRYKSDVSGMFDFTVSMYSILWAPYILCWCSTGWARKKYTETSYITYINVIVYIRHQVFIHVVYDIIDDLSNSNCSKYSIATFKSELTSWILLPQS